MLFIGLMLYSAIGQSRGVSLERIDTLEREVKQLAEQVTDDTQSIEDKINQLIRSTESSAAQ
jgi:hypothetical protein